MAAKMGLFVLAAALITLSACGGASNTTGTTSQPETTVTAKNIYVDCVPVYGSNDYYHEIAVFTINVDLVPGSLAKAGITYLVDLYENGSKRSDAVISWTPAQLISSEIQTVKFSSTEQEFYNYINKDLHSIFMIDTNIAAVGIAPVAS
jgi:hypothetical protein